MVRLIPLAIFASLFSIINILTMIYARPYILIVLSITLAFHQVAIFFAFAEEVHESRGDSIERSEVRESRGDSIEPSHTKNE